MWIQGAIPGATVTAKEGVRVLGSAESPDGGARLFLSPPIGRGGVLLADQEACGMRSGDTPFPPAPSPPESLPAPVVDGPLRDCERRIRISGVLTGALVTVERTGGPTLTSYFDYPILNFYGVSPPLKRGEVVTARQEFPVCQLRSPDSGPVAVGPNTPVPVPVLTAPVCVESPAVHLGNLVPGARVRILADGRELGTAEAPAEVFTFPLPRLRGGEVLTAQQELCGAWSAESNRATAHGEGRPPAVITEPIVACGGAVHATAAAGSWVVLHSHRLGGEIGRAFAVDPSGGGVEVRVAPLLLAGDAIKPLTYGCSLGGGREVIVQPAPEVLSAPGIGRVMQFMTAVPVTGVVPGARVEVFVNGVWRGNAVSARSSREIAITGFLQVGDQVAARQMLCTRISPLTTPAVMVEKPPVAAFTASPTSGEAPLTVAFTNRSTGTITRYAWDFENNGSVDSTVPSPSNTYRAAGSYTAKLTVEGPGGTSTATASIQVTAMSLGFDQVAVFNCNTDRRTIHLWTRDATAGGAWIDHGALGHQYDGSGLCPVGTPKVVALTDKHLYELVCVDPGLFGCPGNDPTQAACRRFYVVIAGKKGGGTLPITSP